MKRIATWAAVLILVIGGGLIAVNLSFFKDLYNTFFNQQTYVATGDVVLKRLQEQEELSVATGSFEVPVVVCNGSPKSYDLTGEPDENDRTPAQQLRDACDGIFDAKATLLASAEVNATIDLGKLTAEDIDVSGSTVTVRLPPVELARPSIDAERGMSVIAIDGSVPVIGGSLPDDYQSQAATEAKTAVGRLAGQSGLPKLGAQSAQSLFGGLLSALGFTEVSVIIEDAPLT